MPLLDAFSCGVPVLACNTSSIPEVTGSEYPLADPSDPATFVPTLTRLLEEKESWIQYGHQRGKGFKWERMLKQVADFYQKLTGEQDHMEEAQNMPVRKDAGLSPCRPDEL